MARHKRKRLKKLLMGLGHDRVRAEWLINVGLICDMDYAAQIDNIKTITANMKREA